MRDGVGDRDGVTLKLDVADHGVVAVDVNVIVGDPAQQPRCRHRVDTVAGAAPGDGVLVVQPVKHVVADMGADQVLNLAVAVDDQVHVQQVVDEQVIR